jgi:Flp pilus assembly protein TadB
MTGVRGALVFLAFVVLGVAGFRRVVRRRRAAAVLRRVGARDASRARGVTLSRWRLERRYGTALALALEETARSLRSGASLVLALGEAAAGVPPPVAGDLVQVTDDAGRAGLVPALLAWRQRRSRADVALAVAALALAAEMGGGQAQAVDGVAVGLRQRLALDADLRAAAAQARLSALVIALAPVGFALFLSAGGGGRRPVPVLFGSSAGLALLAAALALDGVGAWWMVRLTRSRR